MEEKYLTALCAFTYFGPVKTNLLISFFGSGEKTWKAKHKELLRTGLSENIVSRFQNHKKYFEFNSYFKRLKRLGIKFITKSSKSYPPNLLDLEDAPPVVYVKGEITGADVNSVAIVGTRNLTSYGYNVTKRFAGELGKLKVTIVSGLALGIDAVAHESCLTKGGRTIAVLATGLDIITPFSNRNLAEQIVKNGALISEYPLGYPVYKSSYPQRNRIISGLSKAVIVIEAKIQSGTFHTVNAAIKQGREVFALPGNVTSPMSEGTNYLIQNGANVAISPEDIFYYLQMKK